MSFLPKGYEKPKSNNNYFKFKDGDNRFRILSDAVIGFLYWNNENKPVRTKEFPVQLINPKTNQAGQEDKPKHFWAFVIFDYSDTKFKVMEITQKNIQIELYNFHMDEQWGDPKGYDINIKRAGTGIETKYSVMPSPPTPLSPQAKADYEAMNVDLEQLFVNGDPFASTKQPQTTTETEPINIEEPPLPEFN